MTTIKRIPESVSAYNKTPEFTESSVPDGLLNNHQTKAGVWGKIVVLAGELEYTIVEPTEQVIRLSPSNFGVVEPTVLHHVKPLGPVLFYVEFYR